MKREIKKLIFHCTATPHNTTIDSIKRSWKRRGWKSAGYHFIIEANGNVTQLTDLNRNSNGARGYNSESIHISYIGGKDEDDRTEAQIISQKAILKTLLATYPEAEVLGHRDLPNVSKSCPRFDAKTLLT